MDVVPPDLATEMQRFVPCAMFVRGAGIERVASRWCVGFLRDAVRIERLRAEAVTEDVVHIDQLIGSRESNCLRSASLLLCLLLLCVGLGTSMCDCVGCCSYLVAWTMLQAATRLNTPPSPLLLSTSLYYAAAFVGLSALEAKLLLPLRPQWKLRRGDLVLNQVFRRASSLLSIHSRQQANNRNISSFTIQLAPSTRAAVAIM